MQYGYIWCMLANCHVAMSSMSPFEEIERSRYKPETTYLGYIRAKEGTQKSSACHVNT